MMSHGEAFAPLFEAAPEPPSGRIRHLSEARSALRIPTSAAPEVLKAWGTPQDFQLIATPVNDPAQPNLLAEFAALTIVRRQGRRLIQGRAGVRLSKNRIGNVLWVTYGSAVQTTDGTLVLGSLGIGPAFTEQLSRNSDEIARGITAELLRLQSPASLLSETVEYLQRHHHWNQLLATGNKQPIPKAQQDTLSRLNQARPKYSRVTDEQLADLAKRYIVRAPLRRRHPLPQLASEFGITREQAKDRIYKARKLKYLQGGRQGRAGAEPGPRLRGWQPPEITTQGDATTSQDV